MVARTAAELADPLVSILIPVYNRPVLVERAIESARAQTHAHCEIVVIDNCSTDSTWDTVSRVAARDPRIRSLQNATNLGPLRSWVRGLQECRGDFIKILWSDDWMAPTFVEDGLAALRRHSEAGIVFTSTLVHSTDRDRVMYHFPERAFFPAEEFLTQALQYAAMPVSPGCTLVDRRWARFRTDFPQAPVLERIALETGAGADMLFIWEAAAESGAIAHLPKFLSHFDCSPTSFTMTQSDRVHQGYRLATSFFVEHVVRDAGQRQRLLNTRNELVHRESPVKRWERAFRHAWRGAAVSLAMRLGLRSVGPKRTEITS